MPSTHLHTEQVSVSSTLMIGLAFIVPTLALCTQSQAADGLNRGRYSLPDDPSWTKAPSGKHRQMHVYDLGASKKAIVKDGGRPWDQASVGVAISRNGEYGTAAIRYAPYSRCHSSVGREACRLTVTKGKEIRRFAFSPEWSSDIVVKDVQGFVTFVDGPNRFTISYMEDKGKRVTLKF